MREMTCKRVTARENKRGEEGWYWGRHKEVAETVTNRRVNNCAYQLGR